MGLVEWLRPGEHERVEAICDDMAALGVTQLRTRLSWADWHRPEGAAWYDWLLPFLARRVEVLPCFTYTPPSLGLEPKTAVPAARPESLRRLHRPHHHPARRAFRVGRAVERGQ